MPRFRGNFRHISVAQTPLQGFSGPLDAPPCIAPIRFTLNAIPARVHSSRTASSPRSENDRKPICALMIPNTVATVCLRNP